MTEKLKPGYSRETFAHNYKILRLQDGYPQKEALAIAYEEARKSFLKRYPQGVLPTWLTPVGGSRTKKKKASTTSRKKNPVKRESAALLIADWCTKKKLPLPVYAQMMDLFTRNPGQWRGKDISDLYAHALKTLPRKKNPVPLSKRLQKKRAQKLYHDFTGHRADKIVSIDKPLLPDVMSVIGDIDGILYTTVRDGKTERYIHEFADESKPLFCVSPDGRQLWMIGGSYNFTERGIVDRT